MLVDTTIEASLVAQTVKNLPAMWETWVQSLGWEDPLEEGMATHSTFLACRIPWTEEPGRLQSIGSQRVRHNGSDLAHAHTSTCIPQAGVGLLTLISNLELGLQAGSAYTSSFYTH